MQRQGLAADTDSFVLTTPGEYGLILILFYFLHRLLNVCVSKR